MNDEPLSYEDMQTLADQLANTPLYWQNPTTGAFHQISLVQPRPVDIEGDGMPVPVAYIEGGYIDLENTFKGSFFSIQPIF